jgi:Holliday junction resolvasome RuvABC endonuclease subunit
MLVLGIDEGVKAGWAIVRGRPGVVGRALASGVARTAEQREEVLAQLQALREPGEEVEAVLEDHSGMPLHRGTHRDAKGGGKAMRSTRSILGQGASAGKWLHVLELARIRVRRATPNEWFCAVLGLPARTPTTQRKEASKRYAKAVLGREPKDDNEADAVCMALYGAMTAAQSQRRHG